MESQALLGPVTHIATIPIEIGSHRELATFQVAKLQHHEVILGLPWLKNHNPSINWEKGRITCDSKRGTTWCLKESPIVYTIPGGEAWAENLKTRFVKIQVQDNSQTLVKKLHAEAK